MPSPNAIAGMAKRPTQSLLNLAKEMVRPYYLKWFYFNLSKGNCPSAFRRWNEFDKFSVDQGLAGAVEPAGEMADILFLPMADWHGLMQRTQQLGLAFEQRGHRCFYLNPHLGREFAQPFPFSDKSFATQVSHSIFELHVHLPREPVFHERLLDASECDLLATQIVAALKLMGSKRQIIITSFPVWTELALLLRERTNARLVYDCHDLLEGFGDIGDDILQEEKRLLERSDGVCFTSDWLNEEHQSRNRALGGKSIVVRNGVNPDLFTAVGEVATASARPQIGYVGSLNWWFDADLVRAAAQALPEYDFVIIGASAKGFQRGELQGLPNVRLEDEKPYGEMIATMREFHAGIIPFQCCPLTQATNPIKLYEYFACGLPVVSTPMPEVERYAELVYLADSTETFVAALRKAVAETDATTRARRRLVAVQETWSLRADSIFTWIGQHTKQLGAAVETRLEQLAPVGEESEP